MDFERRVVVNKKRVFKTLNSTVVFNQKLAFQMSTRARRYSSDMIFTLYYARSIPAPTITAGWRPRVDIPTLITS